jgi:hypothetical protein
MAIAALIPQFGIYIATPKENARLETRSSRA